MTTSNDIPQYPLTADECNKAEYFKINDVTVITGEYSAIIQSALEYKNQD